MEVRVAWRRRIAGVREVVAEQPVARVCQGGHDDQTLARACDQHVEQIGIFDEAPSLGGVVVGESQRDDDHVAFRALERVRRADTQSEPHDPAATGSHVVADAVTRPGQFGEGAQHRRAARATLAGWRAYRSAVRPPHLLRLLAVVVAAMLAATACQTQPGPVQGEAAAVRSGPSAATTDAAMPSSSRDATTESATVPDDPPATAALPPACAALSLPRRAALVLVVGMPDVTDPGDPLVDELAELGVGGVFLTGYNVAGRDQFASLVAALGTGRAPRPLITTDEEWGRVSSFRDLLGPTSSPRTLAATRSPAQVRAAARDLGVELADLGVDWNFAPVADLDDGPAGGVIGDRAFAAAPDPAGVYARAFSRGLRAGGVLPTVKHFPGHGAVAADVDPHSKRVPSNATLAELRARHLPPFERLIADDVPVVMLNHVTYRRFDRLPASMSPRAYELLRSTGFDGVAITDSVGMGAVHRRWDFPAAAEQAVQAGADAVLATDGRQARRMRRRLVAAVRTGRLDEARLDEAVGRMLRLHPGTVACDR
ncbi:hypothetical protein BH23ACT10_BH23ACT10_05860 [soil metagenome]